MLDHLLLGVCSGKLFFHVTEPTAVQTFPGRSEEVYDMSLTRVVYIEATDFREDKPKGYYGFCPEQPIMLKCGVLHAALRLCISSGC